MKRCVVSATKSLENAVFRHFCHFAILHPFGGERQKIAREMPPEGGLYVKYVKFRHNQSRFAGVIFEK